MAIKKDVLQLELTTTGDGRVKASLAGVSRELDRVDRTGQGMLRTLGNAKTLFAGLATGALVAMTKGAISSTAALQAQAEKLNLSTDALQVYQYAAGQTNVEQAKLDMGLQRLIRRAGDAARGIGESAKVFDQLGVAVTNSNGTMRSSESIVNDVATAIGRMDDEAAQMSATVQLVDSEGAGLVRTFRAMASGTRNFEREARELGIVIDASLIQQAGEADAKLDALGRVVKTQVVSALIELAPLITEVGGAFLEAAKGVRQFFLAGKEASSFTLASDIEAEVARLEKSIPAMQQRLGRALAFKNLQAVGGSLYDEASGDEILGLMLGNFDLDKISSAIKEKEQRIISLRERLAALQENASADNRDNNGGGAPPGGADPDAAARQNAIDKLVASLQAEADTYGLSAGQIVQYNLAKLGASDATLALASSLSEQLAAAQAATQAEEAQARLHDEAAAAVARQVEELNAYANALTRTHNPAQQTADDLRKIEQAFDAGLISADTYFNAVDAAFDKMNKGAEDNAAKVGEAWKDLGLTFSSAFEEAIIEGGNLRDILKGLEQDILRVVTRELVTKPLGNAVAKFAQNLFGGSFFGAATGADFIVPGTGGLDRQFLPVSSGERVTVTPPGQVGAAAGGNTYVTMNVTTPDAGSFRASERNLVRDIRARLAGAG